MRARVGLISLATAWATAHLAPAQSYGGEGPGIVQPPATAAHLGAAALGNGVTEVGQLALTRIRGDSYYLTATVRRTGGAGGWDAMSGTWDEATRTFVRNNDVDHLNGSGDEFSCTVSPDLLTVALDTPTGVKIASRATPTGAFGAAVAVVNAPAGYLDPVLCQVQGLLSLAFIQGNDLMVGNLSGGELSHVRVLIASSGQPLHSPSIVSDVGHEARSVAFSQNEGGGRSTAWINTSLRAPADGTLSFEIMDRPSWLANPATVAGTLRYAEAINGYGDPVEIGVLMAHSTCITTSGGPESLTVTAFAPVQTSPTALPLAGAFLLGNLGLAPIRIPGILGSPLGLDPRSVFTLAGGLFDMHTGTLRLTMDTPPLPSMRLFITPVAVDNNQRPPRVFLGNTAPMVVEDRRWCQRFVQAPNAAGNCPAGYVKVQNYRVGVAGTNVGATEPLGSPYCLKCGVDDPLCPPKKCLVLKYADRTYWENGTKWTEYKYDCACQ